MEVVLSEVRSVDVAAKIVVTTDREFSYDYLILATGSRHSYFGHDEWEKLAPGLKSLEDAIEIRRRILMAFSTENYGRRRETRGTDVCHHWRRPDRCGNGGSDCRDRALHFAERFSPHRSVECASHFDSGGTARAARLSEDLSEKALDQLRDLGVEVRTGVHATSLTDAGLEVGDEFIPCRVKIWAAGNTASFCQQVVRRSN